MHLRKIASNRAAHLVESILTTALGPSGDHWNKVPNPIGDLGWVIRLPTSADVEALGQHFAQAGFPDWLQPWSTGDAMGNEYDEPGAVPGAAVGPVQPRRPLPVAAPAPTPAPVVEPVAVPDEPPTTTDLVLTDDDLALPVPVPAPAEPEPEPEPAVVEDPDLIDEADVPQVRAAVDRVAKSLRTAVHAQPRGRVRVGALGRKVASTVAFDRAGGKFVAVVERPAGARAVEAETASALADKTKDLLLDILGAVTRKHAPQVESLVDALATPLLDLAADAALDAALKPKRRRKSGGGGKRKTPKA